MRSLFEENAIDIDSIIDQGWLEEARSLGRLRLVESIMHKSDADPVSSVDLADEGSRLFSVAAYQYAFMVVCASFDERLVSRWAEGESSLADRNLGLDSEFFEAHCAPQLVVIPKIILHVIYVCTYLLCTFMHCTL